MHSSHIVLPSMHTSTHVHMRYKSTDECAHAHSFSGIAAIQCACIHTRIYIRTQLVSRGRRHEAEPEVYIHIHACIHTRIHRLAAHGVRHETLSFQIHTYTHTNTAWLHKLSGMRPRTPTYIYTDTCIHIHTHTHTPSGCKTCQA
jgi:hypothetical protein